MVTAEQHRSQVLIAGVPWPAYKVRALVVAVIALLITFVATTSTAAAVLTAAGVGTAVWLAAGGRRYRSGEGRS